MSWAQLRTQKAKAPLCATDPLACIADITLGPSVHCANERWRPLLPPHDLIGGPYTAPSCAKGAWLHDEVDGLTEVGGWTTAPISWPRRKKSGRPSLILTGDLVRALHVESVAAICHWWSVGPTKVWHWRQSLGIKTTPGSHSIARRGVPEDAAARGRAKAASPESLAKMAKSKTGVPAHPRTRDALLRAAKAAKPDGWGKRANKWMQDAKRK